MCPPNACILVVNSTFWFHPRHNNNFYRSLHWLLPVGRLTCLTSFRHFQEINLHLSFCLTLDLLIVLTIYVIIIYYKNILAILCVITRTCHITYKLFLLLARLILLFSFVSQFGLKHLLNNNVNVFPQVFAWQDVFIAWKTACYGRMSWFGEHLGSFIVHFECEINCFAKERVSNENHIKSFRKVSIKLRNWSLQLLKKYCWLINHQLLKIL